MTASGGTAAAAQPLHRSQGERRDWNQCAKLRLSDIVQAERDRGAETLRRVSEPEAPAVH